MKPKVLLFAMTISANHGNKVVSEQEETMLYQRATSQWKQSDKANPPRHVKSTWREAVREVGKVTLRWPCRPLTSGKEPVPPGPNDSVTSLSANVSFQPPSPLPHPFPNLTTPTLIINTRTVLSAGKTEKKYQSQNVQVPQQAGRRVFGAGQVFLFCERSVTSHTCPNPLSERLTTWTRNVPRRHWGRRTEGEVLDYFIISAPLIRTVQDVEERSLGRHPIYQLWLCLSLQPH